MAVMSGAEFLLWAAIAFVFLKKQLRRRFPAMGAYLALHVICTPLLLCLLYLQAHNVWPTVLFPAYFFCFWAVYIASAVTLFFVALEVFRSALSAFSGLMRFGTVVFRWAAVVSIIVSLASASYAHKGILIMPDMALGLMRSVSVLELCLLAFLCLSMNALRLSVRDLAFGIALGFGMLATNDFVVSSLWSSKNASLTAPLQFVNEILTLLTLSVWVTYFALPEPVRQPMVVAANSTIYRWNEIASALGHTGTQVAVVQPSSSFFLTDVEKVVDKVLTRNLRESETKS